MKRLLMIVLVACGLFFVGCHKDEAKHYPVSGEVISVDVPTQMIMLKHGDIPGFMPAMTMDYKVADGQQIAGLKPGTRLARIWW
jgi:Cu/Ag efflux protein CusF